VGTILLVGDGAFVGVLVRFIIPPVFEIGIRVGEIEVLLYAKRGCNVGVAGNIVGVGTLVGTLVGDTGIFVGTIVGTKVGACASSVGRGGFVGSTAALAVGPGVGVSKAGGGLIVGVSPVSGVGNKSTFLVYVTAAAFVF
jgi:hypothetical protein